MKDKILKEFETYYCLSSIMDVESQNEIKQFLIKALTQTREETIREIIGMCVNFDDYNNDQIISKEMLQELLNKLKK